MIGETGEGVVALLVFSYPAIFKLAPYNNKHTLRSLSHDYTHI